MTGDENALDAAAEENMAVVRRWFEEGIIPRNFDLLDELFSPRFQAVGGASGNLDRLGYKTYLARVFEMNPDMEIELLDLTGAGDIVVSQLKSTGSHTGHVQNYEPTGNQFEAIVIDIWKVEDGLITCRETADFDANRLREQLGFVPRFKR